MTRPPDFTWLGWPVLGSSTIIADQAASPLDMTLVPLGVPPLPVIEARVGHDALKYAGDNGFAGRCLVGNLLGGKLDMTGLNQATLEMWVQKIDAGTENDPRMFGHTDGNSGAGPNPTSRYIMLMAGFFNTDAYMKVRVGTNSQGIDSTHILSNGPSALLGKPYHLVVTINLAVMPQVIFYYEGAQVFTVSPVDLAQTFAPTTANHQFTMGSAYNDGTDQTRRIWSGDNVKGSFYKRAITATEVSALYALGPGPEGAAPADQVGWRHLVNQGVGFGG